MHIAVGAFLGINLLFGERFAPNRHTAEIRRDHFSELWPLGPPRKRSPPRALMISVEIYAHEEDYPPSTDFSPAGHVLRRS